MTKMNIEQIQWPETIEIRHLVLWPDKPPEFCQVEGDNAARHFGVKIGGELVSVASIFTEGSAARLRKFATLPAFQGQGIGTALLEHMIALLKGENVRYFWCDARESSLALYQRFGMRPEGERFYKGDNPYFRMGVCFN